MIQTSNIRLRDIVQVFFPSGFYGKYRYLGSVPWDSTSRYFKALEPLVIFMDYKAKPWWCPRWFLRFLHLFGNDNSIIRVRNHRLSDLKRKITGGILIVDHKTKWTDYDLRISIYGNDQCNDLANSIEREFYNRGLREDLADQIKSLDPDTKMHSGYTIESLKNEIKRLEDSVS